MQREEKRILVLGAGGREHAIVWALHKTSPLPLKIWCVPGNAGIAEMATCVSLPLTDQYALVAFAQEQNIDQTFVGPEGPLAEGLVDTFRQNGLTIAGPSRAAARLESSKVFAKGFMSRNKIPTARYQVVSSLSQGREVLQKGDFGDTDSRVVIKADGLAAGKGVVVANSRTEAQQALTDLFGGELIGSEANKQLLIEEALTGYEASVLLFADGKDYRLMPAARDHKRIGENDTGPNTGGMGAITDISVLNERTLNQVVQQIIEPTLLGAESEGFPFKGVLFVGLMLTEDGPKVLEYNVRFGDPEAQAILIRLKTDLSEVFSAVASERLGELELDWTEGASVCVVLASRGYPSKYETGKLIVGLDSFAKDNNVQLFHAGTSRSPNGEIVTAGGRVLGVTATGNDLAAALRVCYDAVASVSFPGMQYRRDIGKLRAAAGNQ